MKTSLLKISAGWNNVPYELSNLVSQLLSADCNLSPKKCNQSVGHFKIKILLFMYVDHSRPL